MMRLEVHPVRHEDGFVTRAATIANEQVWFRVPGEHAEILTDSADPFVVLLIHYLMETGRNVHVAGQVSPSLLRDLEEYMAIYHAWLPDKYTPVRIDADTEREPPPPTAPAEAIMGFSGGVDSCYTAWRHTQGLLDRRRANLGAGVFIHGVDLHPTQARVYDDALAGTHAMLDSIGLAMLRVATNVRVLDIDHYYASGPAVIACLLLFQKRYPVALMASSAAYANLAVPAPTSPMTDHLLSTAAMRIVYDGGECLRTQRVAHIGAWPEARRHLRVCWQGPDLPRNCCRCDKCMRTILNFRVTGHGLPECFADDVTNAQIRAVKLRHMNSVRGYKALVMEAEARGVDEPWVREVRRALRRFRRWTRRRELKRAWWRLRHG